MSPCVRLWSRLCARGLFLLLPFALAACSPAPADFHSNDISGARYGQDWRLTDHHGQPRQLEDFRGQVVTVFFGYTQCPDVCPLSLAQMSAVMELLGADSERVQVLFITVDPERDTPELLAEYMPAFDERFLGLYGSADEIARVAQEFRVYYRKSGDLEGHYTVDHSAGTYLFDPQGRLRLYARYGMEAADLAADIRSLLAGH